jgi:hypothetical protein
MVVAEVQKWLWEQDIFHHKGFETLIICYDKCLNKFWDCVEKQDECLNISV